jgi:hypothetical protein
MNGEAYRVPGSTPEAAMFLVKGRLLGTLLSLLVAALGATLVSRMPVGEEQPPGCAAPVAAATFAAQR